MTWAERLAEFARPFRASDGPAQRFEQASRRQRQRLIDTIILGVVGALAAQLFLRMVAVSSGVFMTFLAHYHAPALPSEGGSLTETIGPYGLWLVPVATMIGGLIVGLLVYDLAPEAEGHGTDTVIRAFHQSEGVLRGRVAPVKMVASAITIGSGGAAGREGPVALITAGFGSWYASLLNRDAEDRRLILLIGMAAGLSAIFRSPIGTAIMAVEVLYSDMEFEPGALLYTMLAAVIAYAVNGLFVGWQPLFQMPGPIPELQSYLDYGWYVGLGLAAGILGTLLPVVFYGLRDWFRQLPVPAYVRPAIGGLLTGLLALVYPQVIGGGYGWMQLAIDGKLVFGGLVILAFAKMLALSFSVASGGSGGVFAPSLFMGAMLGGGCAVLVHQPPAPFVVVGMAAVFAASAHLPIATMMMVTEMTGGYTLLVPAALAVMVSYIVQMRLSARLKYRSIYEAQVPNRAESPAHRADQLTVALRLFRRESLPDLSEVGDLDLLSLLRSNLSVEVPGGRQLIAGTLKADSPFVATTVGASGRRLGTHDSNIIAIVRGDTFVVPRAETVLEAGDRLIVVVEAADADVVRRHLAGW